MKKFSDSLSEALICCIPSLIFLIWFSHFIQNQGKFFLNGHYVENQTMALLCMVLTGFISLAIIMAWIFNKLDNIKK